MKRSELIVRLSWEHNDALKFSQNVARGLSLNTDLNLVRSYAVNIADNFLEPHFDLEESALVSRLNETQLRQESVVEVLKQHREFSLLKQQLRAAEASELRPLLERFGALLIIHVMLEEHHFFPFIEQALSTEQLLQAEREIDPDQIVDCSNWPDPFWKSRI